MALLLKSSGKGENNFPKQLIFGRRLLNPPAKSAAKFNIKYPILKFMMYLHELIEFS